MKHAEDILAEKEIDYIRGFLDAASVLYHYSQDLQQQGIPEDKRFSSLVNAVENAWGSAVTEYEDSVKKRFGFDWKVEKEKEKE
jgi:hypothetical protein